MNQSSHPNPKVCSGLPYTVSKLSLLTEDIRILNLDKDYWKKIAKQAKNYKKHVKENNVVFENNFYLGYLECVS